LGLNGCLHCTAGCTTGWESYANEPSQAALEQASQDVYDVIAYTHAARRLCGVWTVDIVARLTEVLKKIIF